jgi:hypothetical protein
MTPDMKRLCEAAANVELGPEADYLRDWQAEAVVRAVLTALREPSDAVKKAAEEDTEFYGAGEHISYDAGETIARAVDFILAEPAKA